MTPIERSQGEQRIEAQTVGSHRAGSVERRARRPGRARMAPEGESRKGPDGRGVGLV